MTLALKGIAVTKTTFLTAALALSLCSPAFGQAMGQEEMSPPTTQPGGGMDVEIDQSSPKATAKSFIRAVEAENIDAMLSLMSIESDETRETMKTIAPMMSAMVNLNKAMEEKFPEDEGAGGMGAGMQGVPDESEIDDAEVTEDGDKATLTLASSPEPMTLVKTEDKWYVEVPSDVSQASADDLDQAKRMIPIMSKAMSSVAEEIRSGKIPSRVAAEEALQQRMMQAMMQGMQQNGMEGGMEEMDDDMGDVEEMEDDGGM